MDNNLIRPALGLPKERIIRILIVVGVILLIPLGGNIFVSGWNWSVTDFVVMGALLFVTGWGLELAVRHISQPKYKAAACAAIILALLGIWVELAVGGVSRALTLFF